MEKRNRRFQIIVGLVILLFVLSAVFSVTTIHGILSQTSYFVFWLVITVLGQGPFIIIPLDRGRVIRFIMGNFPQWLLQLVVSVPLTNLLMLPLCAVLYFLPQPDKVYDVLPFVLLAAVNILIFRSANRVIERRFVIPVEGLPDDWRNLTILHLSDIHAGPFLRKNKLEKIVKKINSRAAFDLCALTGDIVNHESKDLVWALPILEKLRAPLGIFASLGNHEYIEDEHKIIKTYEKSSIPLLRDNSILVSDGRHHIRLIGIDYPFEEEQISAEFVQKALERSLSNSPVVKGEMRVLLSHHPNGFIGGRRAGVPLTLAGHTHGGQVIVMGMNIISRFARYKRGVYRKNDNYLYVSSGLGNWMPFRINCPCEYALITIVRKEKDSKDESSNLRQ